MKQKILKINREDFNDELHSMLAVQSEKIFNLSTLEKLTGNKSDMKERIIEETLEQFSELYDKIQGKKLKIKISKATKEDKKEIFSPKYIRKTKIINIRSVT